MNLEQVRDRSGIQGFTSIPDVRAVGAAVGWPGMAAKPPSRLHALYLAPSPTALMHLHHCLLTVCRHLVLSQILCGIE